MRIGLVLRDDQEMLPGVIGDVVRVPEIQRIAVGCLPRHEVDPRDRGAILRAIRELVVHEHLIVVARAVRATALKAAEEIRGVGNAVEGLGVRRKHRALPKKRGEGFTAFHRSGPPFQQWGSIRAPYAVTSVPFPFRRISSSSRSITLGWHESVSE